MLRQTYYLFKVKNITLQIYLEIKAYFPGWITTVFDLTGTTYGNTRACHILILCLCSSQSELNKNSMWSPKRRCLFFYCLVSVQFSCVRLFATPWIPACQASLTKTNSQSLLKLTSIELAMPSSHLILGLPLLLLPPVPPSIRVFSNQSTLLMRWPKYWSFSFSISPSNEQPGLILGWTGWTSLESKGPSRVFSNTTVQK